MSMAVGGRELHELARRCRQVGDKTLVRKLQQGLRVATGDADTAIRDAFRDAMPKRGGYADVLAASMRVKTSVRLAGSTAKVEIIVYADGAKERRDVPSLNRGRLRHPVFGRTRKLKRHALHRATSKPNPWADTKVPDKSFDKAIDKTADKVLAQMRQVQDEIAAAIVGR